jgi:hypothetical protein
MSNHYSVRDSAEIESSQTVTDENLLVGQERRFNNIVTITVIATTSTFTTYKLATTTITSSVTLGATTAIFCLPFGITIC